ncbi:hypothetical protein SAMN02746041_00479 [Desulfacinum hydrothermale DSM 13146]|uniref:UPF0235 protein SAMN02746041_00479 n=1 Tax=Desulfacinum hydrothermale DSM 13146 TaxID=1121390 RepID=A0A1W1X2Z7_9BACT|nr:DUF167 domain-containing protein [Desulfacinum hydrothermale]SMC18203.1 hypothetical protein SAMN02746041_00479 [Desulfacinum hydrothermale DSM 13146]
MDQAFLHSTPEGVTLTLTIQPNAKKSELVGVHDGALRIRIAAPPVEGAANKECIRFCAKLFGLSKSRVKILKGEKARHKVVLLKGAEMRAIQECLGGMVP